MRQITLRVPDELHELLADAATRKRESVNTYATAVLLKRVRAPTYSAWRQMVNESHRAAGFKGLSPELLERMRTMTGDE
jgi:HicB family